MKRHSRLPTVDRALHAGVTRRRTRNEGANVVNPILAYLAAQGFIVAGQKTPFRLAWAAMQRDRSIPGFVWRQNKTGLYRADIKRFVPSGANGISDIIGVLRGGRWLAIECKEPGHVATPDQEAFMGCVREMGGVAFVACGVEDVAARMGEVRA